MCRAITAPVRIPLIPKKMANTWGKYPVSVAHNEPRAPLEEGGGGTLHGE